MLRESDPDVGHQALPLQRQRRGEPYFQLPADFCDQPVWRAVARRAGASVGEVLCVALQLECLAARSGGSVSDMRISFVGAALAETLGSRGDLGPAAPLGQRAMPPWQLGCPGFI
jgi:hypothetical protein